MKTANFLTLAMFLTTFALLISCSKENNIEDELFEKQNVEFVIGNGKIQKGTKNNKLDDATKVVITIQNSDGTATEYTSSELNLYNTNGNYSTQKIALPVGADYKITEFLLLDVSNNTIFACPLENSQQAPNVTDPLPINFNIIKDVSTPVNVEVISTENLTPEDFGLTRFIILEVGTFNFLVSVSELGSNELLTADLIITKNEYSITTSLEAIVNNIVNIKDEFTDYTLTINKTGYLAYEQNFTIEQLQIYETKPLVIELITDN